MTPSSPSPEERALPSVVDDDGDRVSVTDVNGTIARFEMTYSPPAGERAEVRAADRGAHSLGDLPDRARSCSAPSSSTRTRRPRPRLVLFVWVVEGDRGRPLSASVLAVIVVVSALATVLRTHMRGVLVSDDWVEARYLLPLGIPRRAAGRGRRSSASSSTVRGSRSSSGTAASSGCPTVAKGRELVDMVLQHAQRRRIDVTLLDAATRR